APISDKFESFHFTSGYGSLQCRSSSGPSSLPPDSAGFNIGQVRVLPVYLRIWLAPISVKFGSFQFTSGYGWLQSRSSSAPSTLPPDILGSNIGQVRVLLLYLLIWLASMSVKFGSFQFTSGYGWLQCRSSSGPPSLPPDMVGFNIGQVRVLPV